MRPPRAVLDTNVIVSAIRFGGVPARVIAAAGEGRLDGVVSLHIIGEVRDVLMRRHFELAEEASDDGAADLAEYCDVLVTGREPERLCSDRDDDPVLQTAILGEADYLITGDKALLRLDLAGITILTPAEMLKILEG